MTPRDLIVMGASAGGVEALRTVIAGLPPDLPASVLVVLHMPADSHSMLPAILGRAGPLPAAAARDGERLEPGRVYVATPNHHLLVSDGLVRVVHGPRENGHRPAIDALFRTAARARGAHVVGVVLSGTMDDGTNGLALIKRSGGVAVVQDPAEALFPEMPLRALENVAVDYTMQTAEIPTVLARLASGIASEVVTMDQNRHDHERRPGDDISISDNGDRPARPGDPRSAHEPGSEPSAFACPDCGGVLWELREGDVLGFRCRVGHGYSGDSLYAKQNEALEDALWAAVRGLEESGSLAARLADRARERAQPKLVERFEERRRAADRRAAVIRTRLLQADDAVEFQATEFGVAAGAAGATQ